MGITAVATGRILELLGYRFDKHVTDSAVAAGCGVRRWDGYTMHDDWHLERALAAIRSAAPSPGNPAVAHALTAASVDSRGGSEWWPTSVNRGRRQPHVGKKRRPDIRTTG
jgi:hypothetical protein